MRPTIKNKTPKSSARNKQEKSSESKWEQINEFHIFLYAHAITRIFLYDTSTKGGFTSLWSKEGMKWFENRENSSFKLEYIQIHESTQCQC